MFELDSPFYADMETAYQKFQARYGLEFVQLNISTYRSSLIDLISDRITKFLPNHSISDWTGWPGTRAIAVGLAETMFVRKVEPVDESPNVPYLPNIECQHDIDEFIQAYTDAFPFASGGMNKFAIERKPTPEFQDPQVMVGWQMWKRGCWTSSKKED